jgi:hypothetical protein
MDSIQIPSGNFWCRLPIPNCIKIVSEVKHGDRHDFPIMHFYALHAEKGDKKRV